MIFLFFGTSLALLEAELAPFKDWAKIGLLLLVVVVLVVVLLLLLLVLLLGDGGDLLGDGGNLLGDGDDLHNRHHHNHDNHVFASVCSSSHHRERLNSNRPRCFRPPDRHHHHRGELRGIFENLKCRQFLPNL